MKLPLACITALTCAVAAPAQAQVHYVDLHSIPIDSAGLRIDLGGGGEPDLLLSRDCLYVVTLICFPSMEPISESRIGVRGARASVVAADDVPIRRAEGDRIEGDSGQWRSVATAPSALLSGEACGCGIPFGPSSGGWAGSGDDGFLGVRLDGPGGPRFGWVRVRNTDGRFDTVVAVDAACCTRAGVPIYAGGTDCQADLAGNSAIDVQDFFVFLRLFASADPRADFTHDSRVAVEDFLAFLGAYAAGCL